MQLIKPKKCQMSIRTHADACVIQI